MTVQIVGRSRGLIHAIELAERFAPTSVSILLVGATGTGKELFAQRIHEASGRRGLLVPVNCAALPRDMVESLLFGHRRGAFTGAVEAVVGCVEAADGGTLFLDELASLPMEAQSKLLRVLESNQVVRLGETTPRQVDFRVVASVQEDVRARLDAHALRLDLYQRVAGVVIELAALRERPDDIVPLAEHLTELHGRSLEPACFPVLLGYAWPGNVRELRSVIARAVLLTGHHALAPHDLAEAIALGAPSGVGGPASNSQSAFLIAACEEHGWDIHRTAAALSIHPATLYRRLRAVGVSLRVLRVRGDRRANS